MALSDYLADLDALAAAATSAFDAAADDGTLEAARIEFLGAKSGRTKTVQKQLGAVPGPDKPKAGKRFNEVKTALEAAFVAAEQRLGSASATSAARSAMCAGPS